MDPPHCMQYLYLNRYSNTDMVDKPMNKATTAPMTQTTMDFELLLINFRTTVVNYSLNERVEDRFPSYYSSSI